MAALTYTGTPFQFGTAMAVDSTSGTGDRHLGRHVAYDFTVTTTGDTFDTRDSTTAGTNGANAPRVLSAWWEPDNSSDPMAVTVATTAATATESAYDVVTFTGTNGSTGVLHLILAG